MVYWWCTSMLFDEHFALSYTWHTIWWWDELMHSSGSSKRFFCSRDLFFSWEVSYLFWGAQSPMLAEPYYSILDSSLMEQICSSPNLKESTVIVWDWLWSWKPRTFCDEVCVNAELWWAWQVIKCSQWHDLIVFNIQWYEVMCFLRYAW